MSDKKQKSTVKMDASGSKKSQGGSSNLTKEPGSKHEEECVDVVFSYSRPNSPTAFEFEGHKVRPPNKSVDEIRDFQGNRIWIEKFTKKGNAYIGFVLFKLTLKDWLDANPEEKRWCPKYKGWNISRPVYELCLILKGVILAVCRLHDRKRFHGNLRDPSNYVLSFEKDYCGLEENQIVEVELVNCGVVVNPQTDFDSLKDKDAVNEGIKRDMVDLYDLVFVDSLKGVEEKDYPSDLIHLKQLMKRKQTRKIAAVRWIIADHPTWWHWRSKCHYYGKVWDIYLHGFGLKKGLDLATFQKSVCLCLKKSHASVWKQLILPNTPFHRMLTEKADRYEDTGDGLVHLGRDIMHHINKLVSSKKGGGAGVSQIQGGGPGVSQTEQVGNELSRKGKGIVLLEDNVAKKKLDIDDAEKRGGIEPQEVETDISGKGKGKGLVLEGNQSEKVYIKTPEEAHYADWQYDLMEFENKYPNLLVEMHHYMFKLMVDEDLKTA